MEKIKIKNFLAINDCRNGHGDGCGEASGFGSSYSDGYGMNISSDDIFNNSFDISPDSRFCSGSGYSDGDGAGFGYGHGQCDWFGNDSVFGLNEYIKTIDNNMIYEIDGVATIITNVHKNIAKGYILKDDLILKPCYIAKGNNLFAHGKTIKKAVAALQKRFFARLDIEGRIDWFLKEFSDIDKKYPAKVFYDWHNKLTGSCEMGRDMFVKNGGYDLEKDMFTVKEFIDITRNEYGGDIIKQLEDKINEREL